jgi:uncharacterized C2H2 Zn-finger protein
MSQKDKNQLKMPLLQHSLPISSYQSLSKNQLLNKFYEIIPFKCPFCFTIIELTFEFVEHLSINHYFNIKIKHDKLREFSRDSVNGTTKRKMAFSSNLNEYEPMSKRRSSFTENLNLNEAVQETKSDLNNSVIKSNDESISEVKETPIEEPINIAPNLKHLLKINSLQKSEITSNIVYPFEVKINIEQEHANKIAENDDKKQDIERQNEIVIKKDMPVIKPKITSLIEKQVLQNNQKLNYQLDSVSCGLCALTFKYQSNLIKHLKKKHIKSGQKLCDKEVEKFMITNFNNNNIISTIVKDELKEKEVDIA